MVPFQVEVRDGPARRFAFRTVTAGPWAGAERAPKRSASATSAAAPAVRHRTNDGARDMEIPEDDGPLARTDHQNGNRGRGCQTVPPQSIESRPSRVPRRATLLSPQHSPIVVREPERHPGRMHRSRTRRDHAGEGEATADAPHRIIPADAPGRDGDEESLDGWGFRDSEFIVRADGSVLLTGSRYALSGLELPDLLPWIRKVMGVDFPANDTHDSSFPPELPAPRASPGFLGAVGEILPADAISSDPLVRLRHGHGHTLEEIYAIRYGRLERVPDLVVFPASEAEVTAIVEAATRHDVCLVPYGGGTNVTDALRCPAGEERTIVSVDLGWMNRILWIDPVNLMACIEAGAVGRHPQEGRARHGFTTGQEAHSGELSTLGGWIATHASGMKKNRYGNIEDLVLDLHVVTARGALSRPAVAPRESVGIDPRRWMFGSEGALGIITRAVVKIFPLPEVARYDAVILPGFEEGVAFLYDLTREAVPPASVRLVDNLQFQLSQTLKPRAAGK